MERNIIKKISRLCAAVALTTATLYGCDRRSVVDNEGNIISPPTPTTYTEKSTDGILDVGDLTKIQGPVYGNLRINMETICNPGEGDVFQIEATDGVRTDGSSQSERFLRVKSISTEGKCANKTGHVFVNQAEEIPVPIK